jgi:hypothetical protein
VPLKLYCSRPRHTITVLTPKIELFDYVMRRRSNCRRCTKSPVVIVIVIVISLIVFIKLSVIFAVCPILSGLAPLCGGGNL